MELTSFFKSVIDQDPASVVLCDLNHTIVYMNPAAVRAHEARGGSALLGRSLLDCHNPASVQRIGQVLDWFRADGMHNRVYTAHRADLQRDQYMVALRDETGRLIGYYEKHEYRAPESGAFYELND